MATTNTKGALPEGFASPFKRVPQEDRFDDALACVGILTGKTMADVRKLAEQLGLSKTGPYWPDLEMIQRLALKLGGLNCSDYKDFTSFAALPDVALLLVSYDEVTEIGRLICFHHVRGTKTQQALSYVIDPALHVSDHQRVTTDFGHLTPAYYIEVTSTKSGGKD